MVNKDFCSECAVNAHLHSRSNFGLQGTTIWQLFYRLSTTAHFAVLLCIARGMLSQYVRLSVRHTPVFCQNG